jgi:predicted glycosyltransferase
MDRAVGTHCVRIVLLPRHPRQKAELESRHPGWFRDGRTVIPGEALDGLNLLRQADLMVSGGGTMNREATLLGIPVYSLFRGATGAVDRHLAAEGKLTFITSLEDVVAIPLRKYSRSSPAPSPEPSCLSGVVDRIEEIAAAVMAAR